MQDPDFGQGSEDEEAPILPAKKSIKKKVFAPELVLIDPKPRSYISASAVND